MLIHLRFEGKVIFREYNRTTSEAFLTDAGDRLYVRASGTCMIFKIGNTSTAEG